MSTGTETLTSAEHLPRPARDIEHVPGDYGWPKIGHTVEWMRDIRGYYDRMYATYGPVFRSRVLFEPHITLLGPDANELVLMDRQKNFSSRIAWSLSLSELFPRGLMLRDFDDHRVQRKVMQAAFKKPAMEAYLEQMTGQIGPALAGWDRQPNFRFYPAIKQLTLDLAAHVFAGAEMGPESDKVNKSFVDVVAASIAVIRNPVLGRKYARGLKGRAFLEDYYGRLVPERRGSNRPDMLTQLCNATGDDGESYSDREIVDHMIFLMMAAHDTTTSALTTMAYALAKNPDWQEKVRDEVNALGKDEIEHDDLDRLELTERTFREALRLYTPLAVIPRRALRPFSFGGYEFPANTAVSISPAFTHHMPELWTEPARFDPERFAPDRAEDQNHKFAWVPFGGGAHKCIGMHFAYMQVKAFTHALLTRYRLELPSDYEMRMALVPIAKPKDGLPITIKPV